MATSRGGPATPVKPGKPGKKPWVKPANWEQKTQARWAANHPQPLFPSTAISGKERSGLMKDARTSVTGIYDATPMPTAAAYLQPFADAHARATAAGQNYVNYLDSAATNAQNLSGAFNAALTGGITAGQRGVTAQGGSITPDAPTAAQSLIPAAGVGSSFVNYLNAEKPYVGAAVNETVGKINAGSAAAAGEYRTAQAGRSAEIRDAIQKLYASGLDSLGSQKSDAVKNAVAEYVAMGKTAYQKAQIDQRAGEFKTTTALKTRSLDQADTKIANTKAYQQASLDAKRTGAAAKGIDLKPAYDILLVSTPGKPGAKAGATGPKGQSGRDYTVTPISYTASGTAIEGKPVKRTVYYGETVPKAAVDNEGRPTQRVAPGKFTYPASTAATAATRKATPASWDRAVSLLKTKYPGKITATWLKANFPPRPLGS